MSNITLPHFSEGMSEQDLALAGLHYNGFQEGCHLFPGGHLYTRLEEPRTTFMIHSGETIAEAHHRALIPFVKAVAA